MSKWELQKQLLENATDFESTVEALLDLNESGEISDLELLLNLKDKFRSYSKEKLRILDEIIKLGGAER
ncbi:TPA: hypothetical protein ACGQPJ_001725 [Streptococcus agalactiae]|jgi:hypothetical protein|uniref:Uncharacterized protein n=1 Tax=Streptococcus agalactiae TaxID=1311 RepID=A0A853P569_STRAG|nr:hypothetical protein [Streptococcus agalactiae]HEQ8878261.1 hypothetical protein [Streptococcus pyogenes]EMA8746788.1 hypothetical protein [Streptococcus agalactiae]EPW78539.1 hypothetical protein SAG0103_09055 [Streptococcus agalactiae BSU133]KXA51421.1 hypothetical protein HMPREF1881_00965 [Streptococcus agalactiae]MCH9605551.1 hypothetical protein [Streptococcus agalactiae]